MKNNKEKQNRKTIPQEIWRKSVCNWCKHEDGTCRIYKHWKLCQECYEYLKHREETR